jgi:hypothetical protein
LFSSPSSSLLSFVVVVVVVVVVVCCCLLLPLPDVGVHSRPATSVSLSTRVPMLLLKRRLRPMVKAQCVVDVVLPRLV